MGQRRRTAVAGTATEVGVAPHPGGNGCVMRRSLRVLLSAAATLAAVGASGAPAWADGPVTAEHFSFQITDRDDILTAACGFPVDATVVAEGIDRYFDPRPGGLTYLGTQRSEVTFSAGGNTVTFHERGQERAVENSDGTFSFSVIGRFFGADVIGRLVVDAQTGEIISQMGTTVDTARLCAALST